MAFLPFITLLSVFYLMTLALICVDRYRFFKGERLKDFFNEKFYDESIYEDDFFGILSFIPFLNCVFLICRIACSIFDLIMWVLGRIGTLKWCNKLINMKIKCQ